MNLGRRFRIFFDVVELEWRVLAQVLGLFGTLAFLWTVLAFAAYQVKSDACSRLETDLEENKKGKRGRPRDEGQPLIGEKYLEIKVQGSILA